MDVTITYVEMTSPDELDPGRPVSGLGLEQVDRSSPVIAPTQARIGAPYAWRSATRTPEEWADKLAADGHHYWLIRHDGEIAGIVVIARQAAGDIEIETFGLLPEYVGKGLGGHALTLGVRQAWATPDVDGGPARRVWLHTSSRDNPAALPNYLARGFRPYKTLVEDR